MDFEDKLLRPRMVDEAEIIEQCQRSSRVESNIEAARGLRRAALAAADGADDRDEEEEEGDSEARDEVDGIGHESRSRMTRREAALDAADAEERRWWRDDPLAVRSSAPGEGRVRSALRDRAWDAEKAARVAAWTRQRALADLRKNAYGRDAIEPEDDSDSADDEVPDASNALGHDGSTRARTHAHTHAHSERDHDADEGDDDFVASWRARRLAAMRGVHRAGEPAEHGSEHTSGRSPSDEAVRSASTRVRQRAYEEAVARAKGLPLYGVVTRLEDASVFADHVDGVCVCVLFITALTHTHARVVDRVAERLATRHPSLNVAVVDAMRLSMFFDPYGVPACVVYVRGAVVESFVRVHETAGLANAASVRGWLRVLEPALARLDAFPVYRPEVSAHGDAMRAP